MDANDFLDQIEARMFKAERDLLELARTDTAQALRNHRESKAQGVALARSYLSEMRRMVGPQ